MSVKLFNDKCSALGVERVYEDVRFGKASANSWSQKIKRLAVDDWLPQPDSMTGDAYWATLSSSADEFEAARIELAYQQALKVPLVTHPKIAVICRSIPKMRPVMPGQQPHEYLLLPNVEMYIVAGAKPHLLMISTGPFDSVGGWDAGLMQVAIDLAADAARKRVRQDDADDLVRVATPDWKVAPLIAGIDRDRGKPGQNQKAAVTVKQRD